MGDLLQKTPFAVFTKKRRKNKMENLSIKAFSSTSANLALWNEYTKAEFNPENYPDLIQEVCNDINQVQGTPKEILYNCAIALVSGLSAGKYIAKNTVRNYEQYTNNFFLGIGKSSSGKSIAINSLLKPAYEKEKEYMRAYMKDKEGKKNPLWIIKDATQEGIRILMQETQRPVFSVNSEARQNLNMLNGAYNKNNTEFAFYNSAWDAREPLSVCRATQGNFYVETPMLSLLWLTQPDAFKTSFATKEQKENGFLQRCLFFDFNCPFQRIDKENDLKNFNEAISHKWKTLIIKLMEKSDKTTLTASNGAKGIFHAFWNSFEELENNYPSLSSYLKKSVEKACRLAGVFAICNNENFISEDVAKKACEVVKYSNACLLKRLFPDYEEGIEEKREKIKSFLAQKNTPPTPMRDIKNRFPPKDRDSIIEVLKAYPETFKITGGKRKGSLFVSLINN